MNFHTRKWIKPQDLNPNETLFGGRLLEWIDEEAALYAIIQLENPRTVTKFMSEINFKSSAQKGDIIEIGLDIVAFGRTSLTLKCEVRNKMTRETISSIDRIVMVSLDEEGNPVTHGTIEKEFVKDGLAKYDEPSPVKDWVKYCRAVPVGDSNISKSKCGSAAKI